MTANDDTDQPTARCPFSNPRELFADLADARRTKGLTFSETLNSYVVSRYDEIAEAVGRPEVYSSTATIPDPPPFILDIFKDRVPSRGTLLGIDNPDHDRLRASVSSFFVPRRLRRFEPMIRREAHAIIDTFVSRGEANLKSVFALPLPLKMISSIVGLDPERYLWIGQSLALFGGHPDLAHGTMEDKLQGILDLHDYVREVIEERRTSRRDDLISHVWEMRDTGQVEMTDFEMLSMFPGLILAGHETTTNLLSTGLSHLLHTGQYEAAQQSDEARARAIEELLRYESAITGMRRKVLTPTQLSGTDLKPGDEVFLAYASGSRDETHFDNSGQLDINRPIKDGHLGFGRGIHACLGAPLARLLLSIEFAVIAERLPGLQLAIPYEDIEYLPVGEGRGWPVSRWPGTSAWPAWSTPAGTSLFPVRQPPRMFTSSLRKSFRSPTASSSSASDLPASKRFWVGHPARTLMSASARTSTGSTHCAETRMTPAGGRSPSFGKTKAAAARFTCMTWSRQATHCLFAVRGTTSFSNRPDE